MALKNALSDGEDPVEDIYAAGGIFITLEDRSGSGNRYRFGQPKCMC